MRAQAKQAGPGLDREASFPVPLEAAGPAGPRLLIEEVRTHLGADTAEVIVTLALNGDRFVGSAASSGGERNLWELAAAAAVAAIRQYLHHCWADPSTPQVQLLDFVTITTGIGQEVFAATIGIAHDSRQTDLHGSALVGNDRSRTAVAAVLDAVSRYLPRCATVTAQSQRDQPPRARAAPLPQPLLSASDLRQPSPAPPLARHPTSPSSAPTRSPAGFPAIGVVIGSPAIHAAAVDSRGTLLIEAHRPVQPGADPEAALSLAVQAVREVAAGLDGAGGLTSIGIAVPCQLVEEDGICVSSGEFPEWRHVQLTVPFAAEFARPIACIGPTHAAAYAEFSFGAARGIPDILYLRVDDDIDAALILGGRPALTQLAPNQAGHIVIEAGGTRCKCGESGCWQALAGNEALLARAAKALRNGPGDEQAEALTPLLVARLAASGDPVARRALEETGRYLALGLTNLVALFGPQAVIFDSRPPAVGAALLRAAEASLKLTPRASLLSHCVLLSPEIGESASVIGAAAWAARSGA